jgi:hypothetical protein
MNNNLIVSIIILVIIIIIFLKIIKPAPVDCVVSDWSAESDCSATECGTIGTKTRTRTIITPASEGGKSCPTLTENINCSADPCPEDCLVSAWSALSNCSATACGTTGIQTRNRFIMRPAKYGGADCPTLDESVECSANACPTDCVVSDWSPLSDCSATTCGTIGTRMRTRTVIAPSTSGGQTCPPLVEYVNCFADPCPEDCLVSAWSPLSDCSATTCESTGTQTRNRTIIRQANYGGQACPTLTDSIDCATGPCPEDCLVSDWSPLSDCSATACGTTGTRTRTRNVITPPKNGGKSCPQLVEDINCFAPSCPEDCLVSAWSPYSSCSATACNTTGTQTRTRTIVRPNNYGGQSCPTLTESINCATGPCPVDCVVSDWSPLTNCTAAPCASVGTQTRTRSIITPSAYGGKSCPPLTETLACVSDPCITYNTFPNNKVIGAYLGGVPLYVCRARYPVDGKMYFGYTDGRQQCLSRMSQGLPTPKDVLLTTDFGFLDTKAKINWLPFNNTLTPIYSDINDPASNTVCASPAINPQWIGYKPPNIPACFGPKGPLEHASTDYVIASTDKPYVYN